MAGRRTLAAIIACWPLLAGCSAFEESITHSALLGSRADQKRYEDAKPAPLGRISPQTHLAAGRLLEGQGDFEGASPRPEFRPLLDPKDGFGPHIGT